MRLTLKPFGRVDPAVLDHLRDHLREFGEVTLGIAAPIPAAAFDEKKEQYRATRLFEACAAVPGDRVLAVTEAEICEGELGSVFGYAQIGGHAAVISTAGLQGRRRARRRVLLARTKERERRRFLDRCVKEAIHELGHTLGLAHDETDPRCVMHYSEHLADTDRKGREFCRSCASRARLTLSRLGT